jgi:Phytanoyl-CoA dioxygenase (PhyH)
MLRTNITPVTRFARAPFRLAKRFCRSVAEALPAVSAAQKRQFDRDGFLPINPRFPGWLIERVQVEVAPHHDKLPVGTPGYPLTGRILDAWSFSPAVRTMMTWPRVLRILRGLYGREPMPFQSLNFPVGTEQPIHSDTIHFNSMPAGWMCGVWVALEDIDEHNGPLVYYPGSHKLPEFTMEDVPAPVVPDSYETYPQYERFMAEMVRKFKLQPQYARLRKGQALIWAANLWHGGSPRTDRNRSRHSQVTHFFFEGCRYYTPLYSTREKIYWRNPTHVK